MTNISTQPYKGARDFYPEDMRVRNYIFDTWKRVCRSYSFEEYDFPIVEPLETFAAKSGQEVVNEQMFSFEDKSGRKLALRPELTPGTVRMLAQRFKELITPIKWFMIGNNWRYEKAQRGRGREFYQLEVNIFGLKGPEADFEIIQIIIDIMKAFGATESMFSVLLSDRRLISMLLQELLQLDEQTSTQVRRLMDKRSKMEQTDFFTELGNLGLTREQAQKVDDFMNLDLSSITTFFPRQMLEQNQGYQAFSKLFAMLNNNGLGNYCKFDPSIIRGFDYSDGLVYEVFDRNPLNKRSVLGGERFDKLIQIFGDYELEATGFAMGDVTLRDFLEEWQLLPNLQEPKYLVTLWPDNNIKYRQIQLSIAENLRKQGNIVEIWLEQEVPLNKQLKYADKKAFEYVVIVGEEEVTKGVYTLKNMRTGDQQKVNLT